MSIIINSNKANPEILAQCENITLMDIISIMEKQEEENMGTMKIWTVQIIETLIQVKLQKAYQSI